MTVSIYLKLEGIEGESQDDLYPGWLEILAWSWGASRFYEFEEKKEVAILNDLSMTKYVDRASPLLYQSCIEGKILGEAILEMRRGGVDKEPYLTYKMKNCKIVGCNTGGSGGEDRLTENITISFEKMEWIYYLPKNARKDGEITVQKSCEVPQEHVRIKRDRRY